MALRFRKLDVHVTTSAGAVGTQLSFDDGLVILRADNTSGKSTCITSMLYALGLEGMMGPTQDPPLPDAVRTRIMVDDHYVDVQESHVTLEVENHDHEKMIVTRKITGSVRERQVIETQEGEAGVPRENYVHKSYLVRTDGAAQRDVGFHRRLARFMGLELPEVTRTDGGPVPLYLECIMPFVFVDQWTGWREIKARMPTYLQIPEMAKRAAEYLMRLDIMDRTLRRKALEQQAVVLRDRWRALHQKIIAEAGAASASARGIPQAPVSEWNRTAPHLLVYDGQSWKRFDAIIQELETLLARLTAAAVPRTQDTTGTDLLRLNAMEESRDEIEHRLEQAKFEVRTEQQQVNSLEERLQSLREDLVRYNDEKRLRDRGAADMLRVSEGRCPACDQPLKDALLPQVESLNPMSLEENIAFIKDQISMFEEIFRESKDVLETKTQALSSLRERGKDLDLLIRRQKESMRTDGSVPSAAIIQERLQVESRISTLTNANALFTVSLEHMSRLSNEWRANETAIRDLEDALLTEEDRAKIDELERSFVAQLRNYGFASYPLDEVKIGRETYRPASRGYDLGFTSASDAIRVVWAYLLGLLEVSRKNSTNHPGFLVFDEPRQQSAANRSFYAMLKRASNSIEHAQQTIIATSQEEEDLKENLQGVLYQYHSLPKMILRRMA